MNITAITTDQLKPHNDLLYFIKHHIPRRIVRERTIIVVTSKIVALSEGRWLARTNRAIKARAIRAESQWQMKTKYCMLTIKDGTVMGAAGVDESNAFGGLVLLPRDSYATAHTLRNMLQKHFGVAELGVVITDSRLLPLRAGVVAVALGYAGFKGIREYRGMPDLHGRIMQLSRTDVADSIATAAVLEMGEGNECRPLAIVRDARVEFTDQKIDRNELYIDPREDVYAPLWRCVAAWGRRVGRKRVKCKPRFSVKL